MNKQPPARIIAAFLLIGLSIAVSAAAVGAGWDNGTKSREDIPSEALMMRALDKRNTKNARDRSSLVDRVWERRMDRKFDGEKLDGASLLPFALAIVRDESEHDHVRAEAARLLGTIRKRIVIDFLIEVLAYESASVADVAHTQVFSLTRWENGDYDSGASHEKRKKQARQWQNWWEKHRDETDIRWEAGGIHGY